MAVATAPTAAPARFAVRRPADPSAFAALQRRLTPRLTKYIPTEPTPKQALFLALPHEEAFYGGAAGGGKSQALLMAALQYVDLSQYRALILRQSFQDLSLPGALMERAEEWLGPTDARWRDKVKTWEFPSGAALVFGYMSSERDKLRYRGAEFHYVAFDELTGFSESQYRYMFSRLRRKDGSGIPVRMRSASNPGDTGHDWVKRRFILEGRANGRPFIPARLEDNPHLDMASYESMLSKLDPITALQLRLGDWRTRPSGPLFKPFWFEIVQAVPSLGETVRYWDLAATEPQPGRDPDWTVGCLLREWAGTYYVLDVRRIRATPGEVEAFVRQTAALDGYEVSIHMEQEPGASGKAVIDGYRRRVLNGYTFYGDRKVQPKRSRARAPSASAQAGAVKLLAGLWNSEFLDEVTGYPLLSHDDQVDAFTGAYAVITKSGSGDLSTPESVGVRPQSPWLGTALPEERGMGLLTDDDEGSEPWEADVLS